MRSTALALVLALVAGAAQAQTVTKLVPGSHFHDIRR